MRDGRKMTVPKSGSYRIHPSGVLEVNLDATTIHYAHGEWVTVKDTNQTKMLKSFQDAARHGDKQDISLSWSSPIQTDGVSTTITRANP